MLFVGEVRSPTDKHFRKLSTSVDTKEDEKPKKPIEDDETGKMIDVERSETGRVRSVRNPSGTLAKLLCSPCGGRLRLDTPCGVTGAFITHGYLIFA